MTLKFISTLVLLLAFSSAWSQESFVRIPLKTFTKPAADLISEHNKPLSVAELVARHKAGDELSKLQPIENKYWQNQKFQAEDLLSLSQFPEAEAGVEIDSYLGANRELGFYSVIVKPVKNSAERYILTLGLQVHSSLLKAALLRKLGYYQESPKYYKKIKLKFNSATEKEAFVKTAFCEKGPDENAVDCLSLSAFKSAESPREFLSEAGGNDLYIHGLYLEKMNSEVPSLFDGLTPASANLLTYFNQSRAFRALLVPFALADLGESVNRFSSQVALLRDGWVYINYFKPDYFTETNEDDVQWMLQRAAKLSEQDWAEIVKASHLPESLQPLVKAKLFLRLNNFIQSFYEKAEAQKLFKLEIPPVKYTSHDGYVKEGLVTTEFIPGYPQRFSHGERQSPFESGDLLRYMTLKAQSSVLGVAVNQLNEKIQKIKITNTEFNGFRLSPKGITPVGAVTGYNFGLNFSAARMVTTGTYYGSQAAVQLVDNVSFNAGLGVFRIFEDLSGVRNNTGSNLSYSRDFTHVRPLDSMKEAQTVAWKDVYVPSKLGQLGRPLKDGQLVEFLQALKIGEVFTITESIGVAGRFGYDVGLDDLIGFTAAFQPTVGLTAGAQRVILRQTQMTRTPDGMQVFVRNQNSKAFNVTFDFNYFINLLKIKSDTTHTDLHTDAFILNINSDLLAQIDKGEIKIEEGSDLEKQVQLQRKKSEQLASALRGVIFQSSTEQLYSYFKKQQFAIDHGLKTHEIKSKFLWYRSSKLEEEHLLKIFKPQLNQIPQQGVLENKPIEVVTYKKGEMTGKDYLGFGLDVTDGVLKEKLDGYAPTLSQDSQNPSQMPFGRAQWHTIRTDTELTQSREGALPSVALVQNVWGGWSIKKKKFEAILQVINNRFKGTQFENKEIFPAEVFQSVKKIDFFRITENLTLLPEGLQKIKALLITPDASSEHVDKARFIGRLFQKISEIGNNKARPEDKAIFKNILTMIGEGDEKKGQDLYLQQCKEHKADQNPHQQDSATGAWSKGIYYECLEPWVDEILSLSRKFQTADLREQNKLMTHILYALEKNIPLPVLLKALGAENYLYFVEVVGFRVGDENADQGVFVSNTLGEPAKKHPYSNGLISVFAEKSKIIPIELDRSQASFQ